LRRQLILWSVLLASFCQMDAATAAAYRRDDAKVSCRPRQSSSLGQLLPNLTRTRGVLYVVRAAILIAI
jgi:hypothetical protein